MTFEVCTVKLNIRGQNYHTNVLKNVTPAEYRLLQQIHSPYAVVFNGLAEDKIDYAYKITAEGRKRRPRNQAELQEKLILRYGEKLFTQVFPGVNPALPKTFKEIEILTTADVDKAEQGVEEVWEDIPTNTTDIDLSLDTKLQTNRARVAQKV